MTRERACSSGAAGGACAANGASASSGTVQDDRFSVSEGRRLDLRALFQEQSAAEAELDAFVDRVSGAFLADTAVRNQVPDADAIARHFCSWSVPDEPADVRAYFRDLVTHVVQPATRVASPLMVGHMVRLAACGRTSALTRALAWQTTALPFFQRPLARLVAAMNQNVVKTETASTVTFLEREAVARLHHLFFARPGSFYEAELRSAGGGCLGTVTSGGTVANLTALWCARNCALGPRDGFAGVERAGLSKALRHFGYEGAVILGSEYMHYSIVKAADVLGLGTDGVVRVPANESFGVRCAGALAGWRTVPR